MLSDARRAPVFDCDNARPALGQICPSVDNDFVIMVTGR
jgi:hypothetical protein